MEIIAQKCKVDDCNGLGQKRKDGSRAFVKGYCWIHYQRARKHGSVNLPKEKMKLNGWRGHPLSNTWYGIIDRCYKPSHISYSNYGGKGIRVCDRWLDFSNFIKDMGERPEGKTIDRIDSTKDYSPNNCRWATPKEQSNNTSTNRKLTIGDRTMTVTMWAEFIGIKPATVFKRLSYGFSPYDAVYRPVRKRKTAKKAVIRRID